VLDPLDASSVPESLGRADWSAEEWRGVLRILQVCPLPEAYEPLRTWTGRFHSHPRAISIIRRAVQLAPITPPLQPIWSQEELQRLRFLADDYPPELLVLAYHNWALRHDRPIRGLQLILRAARDHLGLDPITPTNKWLLLEDLSALLDIPRGVLLTWAYAGDIQHHLESSDGRRFVSTRSIDGLSKARPELFAGCPLVGLLAVITNQSRIEHILRLPPDVSPHRSAARLVNTATAHTRPRPARRLQAC
jgi:hypothetical protein